MATLSISVSLKEWTVCSIRMSVFFFVFFFTRTVRDGRKGLDGKMPHVASEIGVSITKPSLASSFFFFQLINKTKKVESF